ncbi:MAG: daunorubicin/doxorubicin resistance transporter ATP-binding protein DrrA [Thermoleophilia bacterium]|jgi:ABC-2 type transport system ATP-binding protein|nr:daunorubicin/doxorubicin resistance transporter ATP-binding protein DrrA [Thermoleophilia bacterium]
MNRATARTSAGVLLDNFDLADAGDRIAKEYSGGMRRRLDIAAGLVVRPAVLFLDEPTTGLDPVSRLAVWRIVRELVDEGTTVLLTTQYLDEADQLANEIVVIDHGTVIAKGTSDQLKRQVGGGRVTMTAEAGEQLDQLADVVRRIAGAEPTITRDDLRVTAPFEGGARQLPELVRSIDDAGIHLAGIELRPPTLDDVFLHLTGRAAQTDDKATEVPT